MNRYRDGAAVALVGPRTALLLRVAPADPLVAALWPAVLAAAPLDAYPGLLLERGLAVMPAFGLVHDTGDGLVALVRGDVRIEAGPVTVSGSQVTTWTEHRLPAADRATVRLDGSDAAEDAFLPILSGVVRAALIEVTIEARAAAPSGSPPGEPPGALRPAAPPRPRAAPPDTWPPNIAPPHPTPPATAPPNTAPRTIPPNIAAPHPTPPDTGSQSTPPNTAPRTAAPHTGSRTTPPNTVVPHPTPSNTAPRTAAPNTGPHATPPNTTSLNATPPNAWLSNATLSNAWPSNVTASNAGTLNTGSPNAGALNTAPGGTSGSPPGVTPGAPPDAEPPAAPAVPGQRSDPAATHMIDGSMPGPRIPHQAAPDRHAAPPRQTAPPQAEPPAQAEPPRQVEPRQVEPSPVELRHVQPPPVELPRHVAPRHVEPSSVEPPHQVAPRHVQPPLVEPARQVEPRLVQPPLVEPARQVEPSPMESPRRVESRQVEPPRRPDQPRHAAPGPGRQGAGAQGAGAQGAGAQGAGAQGPRRPDGRGNRDERASQDIGARRPEHPTGIPAVRCPDGHANPPAGRTCRTCGAIVTDPAQVLLDRPDVGVLVFADGTRVGLDQGRLLGREPRIHGGSGAAVLAPLPVPSPHQDVSRNHLEVRVEGWTVLVTDLDSTNGTEVTMPGRPPARLRPHEVTPIVPGTSVNLAGEVTFTYETPR